jgi:23S rRNA (uracil1939-C5)-methyltransferase
MSAYRQWKIDSVLTTLAQRGIEIQVEPKTVFVQAGTRRRAVFAVTGDGKIGFHRAASHDVIDLQQCDILTPALFAFLQALRRIVGKVLHANEAWDVLATDCENGIDVLITAKASPRNAHRFALADLAQIQLDAGGGKTTDIARISWLVDKRGAQPEPIAQQRLPQVGLARSPSTCHINPSCNRASLASRRCSRQSWLGSVRRAWWPISMQVAAPSAFRWASAAR